MTEIERKALALLNEVQIEMHGNPGWYEGCNRTNATPVEALCRAIEQHEAYKQEVSDAVEGYNTLWHKRTPGRGEFQQAFHRFIIAKPVDPLAECLLELDLSKDDQEARHDAKWLAQTIEKRGGKIVWGEG